MSDEEWALLEPHLPAPCLTGRPRAWPMREIVNAIFYVLRSRLRLAALARQLPAAADGLRLVPAAARRLRSGADIIHSVTNPIPRLTGAIHVYGGDFFDPTHGVSGTRKPCWKDRSIPSAPFAALKRPTQFLRADTEAKTDDRWSAPPCKAPLVVGQWRNAPPERQVPAKPV